MRFAPFGSRALQSRGYTVHEAASGVEAMEVLEEYCDEIDLIVSDVVMPEMDGPTLLREVRKSHPDLKFIFVSGYAEEAFAKNLPEEEREAFRFSAEAVFAEAIGDNRQGNAGRIAPRNDCYVSLVFRPSSMLRQRFNSDISIYSSGLWACSMEPGPQTTVDIPILLKQSGLGAKGYNAGFRVSRSGPADFPRFRLAGRGKADDFGDGFEMD